MYDRMSIYARLLDRQSPLFRTEQQMVRCLYERLDALCAGDDPLFRMWRSELAFTYGDLDARLSPHAKADPRTLGALYGFAPSESVRPALLLQSIQTFYSILIRLIAWNLVQSAGEPARGASLREVLAGSAFAARGYRSLCTADWFSWVVKYWDAGLAEQCAALRACLEDDNTLAPPEAFRQSPDSFRLLYETVLPGELRHALGEYYTPDWLASRALRNALEARGTGGAPLRILDPTCGSGAFLTAALRLLPEGAAEAAGFDINALAVLTARVNYLAARIGRPGFRAEQPVPVYHCDMLHPPVWEGDRLLVDTNCGPVCALPRGVCEEALRGRPAFGAEELLRLLSRREDCADVWDGLADFDMWNRRIIANLLLDRVFAFHEARADIVAGNPPWVNWEYLPPEYREKSRGGWTEYGLFHAKGRSLSFAKEDISTLITCVSMDRFLKDGGYLSFVLRQAAFQSAQNGAGFRRFHLEKGDVDFRVLRVDDLSGMKPFEPGCSRSALVLIRRDEAHRFPVPYYCWTAKKKTRRAAAPPAAGEGVPAGVAVERMIALPADKTDPASVWLHLPEPLAPVMDALLGSNPYRARTGVFTGGANAVYWLHVTGKTGDGVIAGNLVRRAKRKVEPVTAELEPDYLYPLVQGSDLSQWQVRTRSCILCPHTAETKIFPVGEGVLRAEAPRTFAYLEGFRETLEARRGFAGWERGIQERHFYALLRVGEYTFAKYKVAWRYIARSFITAVISSARNEFLGEKLCIPNEKLMYVATDCREEAYYLCGVLSSSPVRYCVACYMNPTSISAHVLDKLRIPAYDPADALHRRIAALCEDGHRAADAVRRAAVQRALDAAVAGLYGIPEPLLQTLSEQARLLPGK